jgi:hypothetical protein
MSRRFNMDYTLRQIQAELIQVPGFVAFSVDVKGDEIMICVLRRSPYRRIRVMGQDVGELLVQLVKRGRLLIERSGCD